MKKYDPEALKQKMIDTVAKIYQEKQEIKAASLDLSLSPNKVKKLLITGEVLIYPKTKQIQEFQKSGKPITGIQETMELNYSALRTYLPYTKVVYKMFEINQKAEGTEIISRGSPLWRYLRHRQQKIICVIILSFSSSIPFILSPVSILLHIEDWEIWGIHQRTFHQPSGEQQISGMELCADYL